MDCRCPDYLSIPWTLPADPKPHSRRSSIASMLRVEGRTITFRVEALDEVETIGSGIHQRVVVSVVRFDERLQRKVPDSIFSE